MGAADEILRGQAFQDHRRSRLIVDEVWHFHQPRNRHYGRLRVRARLFRRVGYPIAGADFTHPLTNRLHHTGRFHADYVRILRHRIASGAMVDISKIETDSGMSDASLAQSRLADFNFLVTKFFRAAIPVNADGVDATHTFLLDLANRAGDHPRLRAIRARHIEAQEHDLGALSGEAAKICYVFGYQYALAEQCVMHWKGEIRWSQPGRQIRRRKIHTDNLRAALDQPFRRPGGE